RTRSVVVSSQFEKVGIILGLRVVLFGPIERAEGHVLHDVKAERLLRRNGLTCSIKLRADFVIAVGPQRLPGKNLRILEQQPPECDKVAVGWPPLVCTGAEKLVELLVAGPGPVRRDAPFPALRLAEPAEAAQTPRRPSAADKIPQRPHPFATPRKSVYFAGISGEHTFNLASQVGTVVGMVETGASRAPAIDIDLCNFGEIRNTAHHDRKGVVVIPSEEIHAPRLHLGR